jgi:hypothetical protein
MRNTACQVDTSSSTPPRIGPSAAPPVKPAEINPMAFIRSASWGNIAKSKDMVDGTSVAPAMPCRPRAAISISGEVDSAARTDAAPNPTDPYNSTLRRPTRSPRAPIAMSAPAIRKP